MKRVKTKVLSILLAVVMMLGLMPMIGQVAHAAGTYTVTFDANGGTGTMESQTFQEGENWTVPECGFTAPEGKVFDKWLVSPKTGTQPMFPGYFKPGNKIEMGFDMIAQAQWKAASATTYTITVNGGKAYSDYTCTTEINSAAADTEIYLKYTEPDGKYGTGWTIDPSSVTVFEGGYFTMPDSDVVVTAAFADQTPLTVDLSSSDSATISGEDVIFSFLWTQGMEGYTTGSRKYDLDNDGNDDVDVVCTDGTPDTAVFTLLSTCSITGAFPLPLKAPDGFAVPYAITIKFPAAPTPVTTYPVWVGGVQVTSENKDDILGDGGKAKFDPDTATLTLDNATLTKSNDIDNAVIWSRDDDLIINLVGKNTITYSNLTSTNPVYGILCSSRNLSFTGTGSLDISVTSSTWNAYGISCYGLTLNDSAEVFASGYNDESAMSDARGLYIYDLTMNGGSLTSTGSRTNNAFDLINSTSNLTIGSGYIPVYETADNVEGTGAAEVTQAVFLQGAKWMQISPKAPVTTYPVWVGSTQVTSANKNDILDNGGKAKFDPDTNTLTLDDVKIESPNSESSFIYSKGIDLTVTGSVEFNLDDMSYGINCVDGNLALDQLELSGGTTKKAAIRSTKDITITGGKIAANSKSKGIISEGSEGSVYVINSAVNIKADDTAISCNSGTFSIEGGTLTAEGGSVGILAMGVMLEADSAEVKGTDSVGITALSVYMNGGSVTADGKEAAIAADIVISGGTLTATGGSKGINADTITVSGGANVTATASAEPESYGIYAENDIQFSDSTVTATPGDGIGATGIYSNNGNITISGGTVTVTKGAGGIYAYNGTVEIKNGTEKVEATTGTVAVRGRNGITIGDELMIKEPADGVVADHSGYYDIMDGSNAAHHALIVPKEAKTYTVTFDANGHGTAPAAQTVNSGEKATEPTVPTETGWTFGGWYQDATCSVAFDFSTAITADITLYAKWTEESTTPAEITYTVTGGADSTWTKGSSSTVTITVKRSEADDTCFSHFTSVQIDGTTLASGDYEAKAGSTVITLKAATLQKLSTGSHTVTINFDDGKAETKLTVKAASSSTDPTSPKTGDNSHMGLWISMMILSLLGLGGMVFIGKKRRYVGKH